MRRASRLFLRRILYFVRCIIFDLYQRRFPGPIQEKVATNCRVRRRRSIGASYVGPQYIGSMFGCDATIFCIHSCISKFCYE